MTQAAQIIDQYNKMKSTININNKKIVIHKLGGIEGFRTGTKLAKVIIPLLGKVFDGLKHDDVLHGAPKTFSEMALLICDKLDEIDIEQLTFRLFQGMTVDGNEVDFDKYFSANYGELLELLSFALKENFQSFFMGKGIVDQLITKIQSLTGLSLDKLEEESLNPLD